MNYTMYIGGYGTQSISRVHLRDGRLSLAESFGAVNASWLCLSPDETCLYAVGETKRFRGETGGSVQSYSIDEQGRLTETAIAPTLGEEPCHLNLVGNLLIAANYGSGSISRFMLNADGALGEALPLIQLEGSGPDSERQEGPHAHHTCLTPGGWLAATDLGTDSVLFYPAPEITAPQPAPLRVKTPAGYGPRHCAFPRGKNIWYVLCELRSELLIYRGGPAEAMLVGRVPIGGTSNFPAALRLSPDEKLLAATGRGENIVSLFAVGDNGMPSLLSEVSSRGDWPRDVQFSPDGRWLICANQRSNTLTAFEIAKGRLEYRSELRIPAPSCVVFTKFHREG